MHLYQFNVSYLPEEDRLLLRMTTTDKKIVLLLFTRRMITYLVPEFDDILEKMPSKKLLDSAAVVSEETQKEIAKFEYENTIQNCDFDTPFDESATESILDELPTLVNTIHFDKKGKGMLLMTFVGTNQQSITITANEQTLYSIYHLLYKASEIADWNIEFKFNLASSQSIQH